MTDTAVTDTAPRDTEPTGKVAIVTGAASGIGEALAHALVAQGIKVLAVDFNTEALEKVGDDTGCETMSVDVASAATNRAIIARCMKTFERLDLAFLNAGVLDRPPSSFRDEYKIGDIDWDRYDIVRSVLLDAVIHGTVAATEAMAESGGGSIMATASAAGLMPWPMTPVYSAAKHAVVGWVGAIAPALERQSVKINAICPGGIATPLVGRVAADAETIDRLLAPADVAQAMIDIAMGDATGQAWSIVANRDPQLQLHEFAPIPGFP